MNWEYMIAAALQSEALSVLNERGRHGWELVGYHLINSSLHFIFKRQVNNLL